jgi:hypothetical protein
MKKLSYKQFASKIGLTKKSDKFTWSDDDVEHHPPKDRKDKFSWSDDDVEHHPKKVEEKTFEKPEDHHSYGNSSDHQHPDHLRQFAAHDRSIKGVKRESLEHYKGSGYRGINRHLRTGVADAWENPHETKKHIKNLDHITSHQTEHPIHVYRGIDHEHSNFHKLKPGDSFTDHGFTSTSHKHGVAKGFTSSTEHVMKIHLPKGTKAHHLDHSNGHSNAGEGEILLHRGTKFHVTHHSKDENSGVHYVHVTAVSPTSTKEAGHQHEFKFGKSIHKAQKLKATK